MTDSITSCTKYVNADGSLNYYLVMFYLDVLNGIDCSTYVFKIDLVNPDDLDEVKTKACLSAKISKSSYTNAEIITTLNGPVSL